MKDHSNGSRGDRPSERIHSLGATVYHVPSRDELPDLVAQITRGPRRIRVLGVMRVGAAWIEGREAAFGVANADVA